MEKITTQYIAVLSIPIHNILCYIQKSKQICICFGWCIIQTYRTTERQRNGERLRIFENGIALANGTNKLSLERAKRSKCLFIRTRKRWYRQNCAISVSAWILSHGYLIIKYGLCYTQIRDGGSPPMKTTYIPRNRYALIGENARMERTGKEGLKQ